MAQIFKIELLAYGIYNLKMLERLLVWKREIQALYIDRVNLQAG